MGPTAKFALGGIIGVIGLLALYMAAAAHSGPMYIAGLIVFVASVLFIMFMVNRAFHDDGSGSKTES